MNIKFTALWLDTEFDKRVLNLSFFELCLLSSERYSTKMDVEEVGGGRGDWMELAQDRDRWRALVSTVKNLRVP
jgi:hypothetical protein